MKTAALLVTIVLFSLNTRGQILFSPYAGYVSGYTITSFRDSGNYYNATIDQGTQYGFDLEYKVDRLFSTGITFLRQNESMPVELHYGGNIKFLDLNVRVLWLLFGGTCLVPLGNSELNFATYLGAGLYKFSDATQNTDVRTRFAWAVRGGYTFFTRGRVGVNIKLNGLFSTHPLNKGLSIPGLADNIVGYTYTFQMSALGGIVLRFGPKAKLFQK
jgi:hypothetical protein